MSDLAIDAVTLKRDIGDDDYERGVTARINHLLNSHRRDGDMWEIWERGEEVASAYEWRSDAMSSLIMTATDDETPTESQPDSNGFPRLQETLVSRDAAVRSVQLAAPTILLHWDIQGSALLLYDADRGRIHVLADAGQLVAPENRFSRWRYQVGDEIYIDVPDNSVIMRAWLPSPVRPWQASPNARVKTIARAIHMLTTSIEATAHSRGQLRDVVVVKGQPNVTRVTRDGITTPPSQGMEGLRAALSADVSATGKAIDAANIIVELLSTEDSIETLSLAGNFDSRAIAMRSSLVEALARAMPVPVQVTLGTQNSNDWSANVADRQAREVYMAAEARRMAQLACYLAGHVAVECGVAWKFDSLGELDALSLELGIDLSSEATRDDIMLHMMLLGLQRNLDIDTSRAWAETIADLWEARDHG